jgi:YhcH/YjgK/YiaL family protein
MVYSPVHLLKVKNPYNEEKDVTHYENDSQKHSSLFIPQNYFCIFFPEDAHKPGLHLLKEQNIKKAVIKVMGYNNIKKYE